MRFRSAFSFTMIFLMLFSVAAYSDTVEVTIEYPGGSCAESWSCTSWSTCANSVQTRTCTDSNNCGTTANKPTESQSCNVVCTESWYCTGWSSCINNVQTRTCTDSNSCGTVVNKPAESQSCSIEEPSIQGSSPSGSSQTGGSGGGGGSYPQETAELDLNFLLLAGGGALVLIMLLYILKKALT